MSQVPPPVSDEDFPEPPRLRRLRLMVSALMVVLILGVIIVVAALVVNLGTLTATGSAGVIAAEAIALPAGEEIVSVGEGTGRLLIVTRRPDGAERLRAFDAKTGAELSVTAVERQ